MIDPGREVQLKAGEAIYVLYAGNRALRLIERETGKPLPELLENLDAIGFGTMTTLVWGMLQRHHPALTVDDVDEIFDAAGYEAVSEAMGQALERAFPAANIPDNASGKVLAANGTGARSSPARSRPA